MADFFVSRVVDEFWWSLEMNFINGVFKFGYGVRFEESYVLDFGLYRFFG